MKKNKKLYKLVIVLGVLLCVCLVINFTHNKMINDNTEIIDIECEGENCEKDTDDNKNNANDDVTNNPQTDNASNNSGTGNGNSGTENNNSGTNGTGNSSGNGSTTGTEPVVTNGDGDKILPTENGNVDDVLESGTVSVNDSDKTWSTNTEISIFDVDKIAPGDSGTYDFVVNNNTERNVNYGINFEENNIAKVNMLYKLKRNEEYIAGDENTWVKYNELNFDSRILNKSYMDKYNIEWKWVPAENDTAAGRTLGAKYGLNIKVDAASTTEYDRYSNATLNPLTGDKILHYIEIALLSMIVLVLLTIKRRQKD